MIKDFIRMAGSTIKNRGMRSWLTMIGIFIGIAAVVSLISLGQAMQVGIKQQFESFGTDVLIIQPSGAGFISSGADNPVQLSEDDESEIKKVNGVIETASLTIRSGKIEYKDDVNFQFVSGIPTEDPKQYALVQRIMNIKIAEGRNLDIGDKFKAVVGHSYTLPKEVFPKKAEAGSKIMIEGQTFDIVGVMKKIGNAADDKGVMIPVDVHEEIFNVGVVNSDDHFRDMIFAQTSPGQDPVKAAESVHEALMNFRGLDEGEEDFTVQTADQLLGSFNTILAVVQFVLIGIAAISLLVGGIGITNTMYTAVLERTREIGIMKAIGAKNIDVMVIFLIESGVLGLIGGAIGVILGYGISALVVSIAAQFLAEGFLSIYFPMWLIFGGLGFSFLVGAVSGVMPAYQASKMNPVDALRYE